jgi:hypothetical protein
MTQNTLATSLNSLAANISITLGTGKSKATLSALPQAIDVDTTKGVIMAGAYVQAVATRIAKVFANRAENGQFVDGKRVETAVNYKTIEREVKKVPGLMKFNADIKRLIKRAGWVVDKETGNLVRDPEAVEWNNFSALMADRKFNVRTTSAQWKALVAKYGKTEGAAAEAEELF